MVDEAVIRGIRTDGNMRNLLALRDEVGHTWASGDPKWMDDKTIMARVTTTHKANLYRKDPEQYFDFADAVESKNNLPCCDRCQYYWVTHKETV